MVTTVNGILGIDGYASALGCSTWELQAPEGTGFSRWMGGWVGESAAAGCGGGGGLGRGKWAKKWAQPTHPTTWACEGGVATNPRPDLEKLAIFLQPMVGWGTLDSVKYRISCNESWVRIDP